MNTPAMSPIKIPTMLSVKTVIMAGITSNDFDGSIIAGNIAIINRIISIAAAILEKIV